MRCVTPSCGNKSSYRTGICNSCYYRKRRTGTTEKRKSKPYRTEHGYVRSWRRNHPMADKTGTAYLHRIIAYDARGEGPHPCYWCNASLLWDEISVDHLNDNREDNRAENLVVSCGNCNRVRGALMKLASKLSPEKYKLFIMNNKTEASWL